MKHIYYQYYVIHTHACLRLDIAKLFKTLQYQCTLNTTHRRKVCKMVSEKKGYVL